MRKRVRKSKSVQIIKKSNDLIEARYRFDIWETRVFLSVLSNIRKDDQDFKAYRIRYNDIIKVFNLRSHQSYDLLRKGAKSLMGKTFKVNSKVDGFDRVKEYHIIRTVDYLEEGQEGAKGIEQQEYIDITVEPEMKPLLLQLQKNFTAYNLTHVAKLGSQAIRLYELLKQYEFIGERVLEVQEMRRMLQYENEYPLFADFYRYFVKPAVTAINKHTDIEVYNQEKIKRGRRVEALHFFFRAKPGMGRNRISTADAEKKGAQQAINFKNTKDDLFDKYYGVVVQKFGVTPTVLLNLLGTYSEEQLEQAIRVTHRANYNQQITSNIAGFFVQALRKGFTDKKEEAQKKQKADTTKEELTKQLKNLRARQNSKINDIIKELTTSDPEITQNAIDSLAENMVTKAILEEKELQLERPLEVDDFRNDRTLRGMVKAKIMEMEKPAFKPLRSEFEGKIKDLKKKLQAVSKK